MYNVASKNWPPVPGFLRDFNIFPEKYLITKSLFSKLIKGENVKFILATLSSPKRWYFGSEKSGFYGKLRQIGRHQNIYTFQKFCEMMLPCKRV